MDNKCQNWRKVANLYLSDLDKWPLERINQIQPLVVVWYHPWEGSCQNRENVTDMFFRKCSKMPKGHNCDLFTFKKNLYSDSTKSFLLYVVNVILKKLHAKKENKLLKRFWDWPFPPPPSPLKVDADADGRVGIWKAPLPGGTAELTRSSIINRTRSHSGGKFEADNWVAIGRLFLNDSVNTHVEIVNMEGAIIIPAMRYNIENKAIRDGKYLAPPHASAWQRSPH